MKSTFCLLSIENIIIVAVVVVVGGTIGGIVGYNVYQEKKQQEAEEAFLKAIEESRTNAVNSYNDRINQIMAALNVEKDGVASLDNNENIDAMTNAVNELNNNLNDINNGTLKMLQLTRIGSRYIPYSGLVCNDIGNSSTYPVSIYELHKGDFYKIAEGLQAEESDHPVEFRYEWEGTSCSDEEFKQKKNKVFDESKGIYPAKPYDKTDFIYLFL